MAPAGPTPTGGTVRRRRGRPQRRARPARRRPRGRCPRAAGDGSRPGCGRTPEGTPGWSGCTEPPLAPQTGRSPSTVRHSARSRLQPAKAITQPNGRAQREGGLTTPSVSGRPGLRDGLARPGPRGLASDRRCSSTAADPRLRALRAERSGHRRRPRRARIPGLPDARAPARARTEPRTPPPPRCSGAGDLWGRPGLPARRSCNRCPPSKNARPLRARRPGSGRPDSSEAVIASPRPHSGAGCSRSGPDRGPRSRCRSAGQRLERTGGACRLPVGPGDEGRQAEGMGSQSPRGIRPSESSGHAIAPASAHSLGTAGGSMSSISTGRLPAIEQSSSSRRER